MKITVCKGCGSVMEAVDKNGKPYCITCHGIEKDNSVPIEVDVPEKLKCAMRNCTSIAVWENDSFTVTLSNKGGWNCTEGKVTKGLKPNEIPFIDTKKEEFYCGCIGWD